MQKYKAIFFDWDGTAVMSRKAPVDEIIVPMKKLLAQGVKLAIISGTTIENIGSGKLHTHFTKEELQSLFLGLGRGAYNYRFTVDGEPELFCDRTPDKEMLLLIHRVCFELHEKLLLLHDFPTDVVFSRPNYCKIDLMVSRDRGEQLFFQDSELVSVTDSLKAHGITGGLKQLIRMAEETGETHGLPLSATTDAKYLEVGPTSKSDNVNVLLDHLMAQYGIRPEECTYWGDEYVGMGEGLYGSDSFMITEKTLPGQFFDVSEATGERPPQVQALGGGVKRFYEFLVGQSEM